MKKFNITVLNVFAILGVILFLVLFVCAAFIANNNPNFSSLILPIIQIILGILTIIFALIFTNVLDIPMSILSNLVFNGLMTIVKAIYGIF